MKTTHLKDKKRLIHILFLIFLHSICSAQTSDPDPWKITATNINPANYYGITVANGMIGMVSSPEVLKINNVTLAGAYDLYGRGRVSNFLNSFNLLNMSLDINGKRVEAKNVSNFKQELDMKHACFTTTLDFGEEASIKYTYYSLRHLPFNVLMDITIIAKKNITINAISILETPDALRDVQNYFNEVGSISLLTSTAKSPTGKLLLCASNTFLFDEQSGQEPRVRYQMWDSNLHEMKFSKTIAAGQTYQYAVTGSSITSAHDADPLNQAERLTIFAKLEGRERLIRFHEKAWEDLWKSDIIIEGDSQAQQDVHSMLYHLYSFSRAGSAYAPSPMGLSGLGYNGHVFWDADLWMYPGLLLLHPEIAKSFVEYRYQRLNAAKQNAFAHGYKGAMFAWESADSGVEETPVWALSGPFEHHITADVALAAWNYYCVTQDKQWLQEKGWPILSATADFWTSRVERNGPGHYDIKNVVAADEWAENIDNDAFTNAAAKANLRNAAAAAKILGLKPDPDWETVAQNIPVLKFPDGVTKEFDTYRGENIKQADVNLLAYPLHEVTNPDAIKKDLEYYESRVGNGPAMTHAIFSILYSRLGNGEKALLAFKNGYQPNALPPFGVLAESAGGTNPYFATGAGGLVQAMLNGFGGLEITPNGIIQVKSKLPMDWKSLKLTGIGVDKKTYIVK
ncbi:glycoside hydrolase family 65 protein [Mariniflexile sp. HMF6888]|uniref:glycoside hydrolase family 65 protein n=1 Tax=Mariniflexile sp. HMF6888 TaxID=3373086 RepID=UPI0037BB0088